MEPNGGGWGRSHTGEQADTGSSGRGEDLRWEGWAWGRSPCLTGGKGRARDGVLTKPPAGRSQQMLKTHRAARFCSGSWRSSPELRPPPEIGLGPPGPDAGGGAEDRGTDLRILPPPGRTKDGPAAPLTLFRAPHVPLAP